MIDIEDFDFDISLIFAVLNGKVSASINKKLSKDLKQENILVSPEQLTVMFALWKQGNLSQKELCRRTFNDKPSMTRLINGLESMGLVRREANEDDRRNNIVSLTDYGKEIEQRAFAVSNQTMRNALSDVTIEELRGGQILLRKIFTNIKK